MEELTISYSEVALRLLLVVVLCGIIGFERETRDQSAGFRTHILLGLGAALFTMVSAYAFPEFTRVALNAEGRGVQFDPTRIAAQIVTGIGFLGAGAIIRQGTDVRGLTTAASLWAAAAIGMAIGAGYFFGGVVTTVIVVLALYLLRKFRTHIMPRFRTDFGVLAISSDDTEGSITAATDILERCGIRLLRLDAELEKGEARYNIHLRIPPSCNMHEALQELSRLPGVKQVRVTGLREVD